MGTEPLISALVGCSWASGLLAGAYYIVFSSIYDAKHAALDKRIAKHPYTKKLKQRPLVSVLIVANNAEQYIGACLESVASSSYRKYEVVVIDNGSTDQTRKLIREFKKVHPKVPIKLSFKRRRSSVLDGLRLAVSKAKGTKLVVLDPHYNLQPKALKNALNSIHFAELPNYIVDTKFTGVRNVTNLAYRAENTLFKVPSIKMTALRGVNRVELNSIYTKDSLKSLVDNNKQTKHNYPHVFTRIALASWLTLVAYFSYIATAHDYPAPFGLSLLAMLVYACFMTLSDGSLNFKDRLKTVATLPGSLTLLYFLAISRTLLKGFRPLFLLLPKMS